MTAPDVRLATVLDDTPVLHRLRLTLAPGEVTVLMGSSGAGKTTLVRHVAGLVAPDRGTIHIGGRTGRLPPPWGATSRTWHKH